MGASLLLLPPGFPPVHVRHTAAGAVKPRFVGWALALELRRPPCTNSPSRCPFPGASGSLFWLSGDDIFIIKTVQKGESKFLRKLLPGYYLNLIQNKRTLLPKFFGHFRYQSASGRNIRFIVMQNLLPSHLSYSERFDLKG